MGVHYAFQRENRSFEPAPGAQPLVDSFKSGERERLPAAPERDAPPGPGTLLIALNRIRTLASLFAAIPVTFWALDHLSKSIKTSEDWFLGLGFALFSLVYVVSVIHSCFHRRLRPYLAVDDAGLTVFTPREFSLGWSQIEGYARQNQDMRRILRVFLRPGVRVAGAVRSGAETYLDLNFIWTETPHRSLDLVLRACSDRLGAAREFAKPPASLRRSLARPAVFIATLAIALAAGLVFLRFHHPLIEEPPRPIDTRQGESVMFLGNSRVYGNDLPKMVRDIADSASSPIRYDVHMRSWLAATFKELWNDEGDRAALQSAWGKVILQPESGAFWDDWSARNTMTYGEKLIRAARAGGSEVALIVNWTRGPIFFDGNDEQAALASKQYGALMSRETRALAEKAGADLIDLEGAFAEAQESAPDIALTISGNDPTHAGSYLAGLVIYGYLSGADLAKVEWRPYDMTETQAEQLKEIAARHYSRRGESPGSIDPGASEPPR